VRPAGAAGDGGDLGDAVDRLADADLTDDQRRGAFAAPARATAARERGEDPRGGQRLELGQWTSSRQSLQGEGDQASPGVPRVGQVGA
jgi:hypothetical protein